MILFFIANGWACEQWSPPAELNAISHPDLEESSGLAVSRRTDGAIWTHDDSGDSVLFRFALDGTVTQHLAPAANNADWEDMASASCPSGTGDCLYIGDIGLERDDQGNLEIYVAKEPKGDGPAVVKEIWRHTWPNVAKDAETLLVHPCTLDAWVITRADRAEVFAIPDKRGPKPTALETLATLAVDEPITGGDFSPDGTQLVLRSDTSVWLWTVDPNDLNAHWTDTPIRVTELDTPGEGIAFDLDGDLLLSDEGRPTPITRMACEDPVAQPVCTPEGCGGCATESAPRWLEALAVVFARRE